MSDTTDRAILKLTEQVGKLEGTVHTYIEGQKTITKTLTDLTKTNTTDIKALTKFKNVVLGLGLIGTVTASIKAVGHYLSTGGH